MRVRDWVACQDPELLLLEGEEFDAAIVGVVSGSGMEDRARMGRHVDCLPTSSCEVAE